MANKEIDQAAKSLSNLTLTPPPFISSTVTYRGLQIPSSWEETANSIAYDSCTCPPPIVLICGPGNCGKSAFSRVLLDALFKRYKKVGYLDTDVGQPEFTPSGCVSLQIIEKETPDFTVLCLKTPEKCLFFGDICAKSNAKDYVFYIFNLYNYFIKKYYKFEDLGESNKPSVPLIVNTSGWIKGFGLDVLVDILRYMSPTHVVKIKCSSARKNLPCGAFWMLGGQKSNAEIIEICAAQNNAHSIPKRKEARTMRDLRFIAYFRQCLPKDLGIPNYSELKRHLADIPPFEISLSKTNVTYLLCQESTEMTYHSWIGTIVGIGISSSVPSSASISAPWCVGLGIVSSIDVQRDKIYLVTPIPLHIIKKADTLFRGSIEIPDCLIIAGNRDNSVLSSKDETVLKEHGN
ncbi:Polynucleotide 5'-hydroxyl-kinase grc3 [Rhynchospora pubera]|uniref:Polynucleotide 5'-hydroxyl-kinase grc3 n=1 Tax=Rhynchospora pubera TaxID=906938 RepID=A0AAV8DVQ3_9POAL|nr:Polynucleotide 5'-hydroxyl-kinase grc3 [Rhynchospora pubera]KAJ4781200.1 Polynucleotide 5'-hydroxyl-kinase grc3 [Rhynchospora pubera]